MINEDFFETTIRNSGSNTYEITIPKQIIKFKNLNAGDEIRVWILKTKKEGKHNELI